MKIFLSYKLRGLNRDEVLEALSVFRQILEKHNIENFIYDLDRPDFEPEQNRNYFVDALPQIQACDQVWVVHNSYEHSIGMMMEIAASYTLAKPVIVWRQEELDEHKPYDMDQCAYRTVTYKDNHDLEKQIQSYTKDLL